MSTKPLQKRSSSQGTAFYVLATLSLVATLLLRSVAHAPSLAKQPVGPSSTSAQFNYRNLDLSTARQATYSSPAVSIIKSTVNKHGVRHAIFRFRVPKDGLSEYGFLTLPDGPAPSNGYPVIILCHGYANPTRYSTTSAYLADMEFYAKHGFAVLKPDYRGQGLSFHDGQPEGAYYSMAYNTDVLSLIAAVKQTNYLDPKRINLFGHSMGAYIALRAAVLSPDIKDVVLLSGPVGSARDLYTSYKAISDIDNRQAATIKKSQILQHGTPTSNPEFWDKTSPLSFLSDMHAVVEINVGTADRIVPPLLSLDLAQALATDHKVYQYYVYPGAGHSLGVQRSIIWSRSLRLFNGQGLQGFSLGP